MYKDDLRFSMIFQLSLNDCHGYVLETYRRSCGRLWMMGKTYQEWFGLLSGWWHTYPSEKYGFVSWDDDIPNIWKVIKAMFQTTNQILWFSYGFPTVFLWFPPMTWMIWGGSPHDWMETSRFCGHTLQILEGLFPVGCKLPPLWGAQWQKGCAQNMVS